MILIIIAMLSLIAALLGAGMNIKEMAIINSIICIGCIYTYIAI